MALTVGTRLGAYEILSLVGAGGMGEVYRARDRKLDRDVAIKVLPDSLAADPDRLARFEREAKTLAVLNHPNIAHIYGVEDSTGVPALVMELVEGPTLAERIAEGPIPIDEALPIAKQIAEALEAAHEQGIIHRDLKPANIKLTGDGKVKVLDFGLAKILDASSAASVGDRRGALSLSPTLSVHATYAGLILGTAAYMSPEQARGRPVDRRADVWAFGCVLFEMLTGTRAFDGDDVAETIGAVIHKPVAWDKVPSSTPSAVRTLLLRCLEKDPKSRVRDVGDVQLALSGAFESRADGPIPTATRRVSAVGVGLAIAGIGVGAVAMWTTTRPRSSHPQIVRFNIVPPANEAFNVQGFFRNLAISDDGSKIAYIAGSDFRLMIRSIDQLDATAVATGAGFPFFSPDGHWVGFFSGASGDLRKVSVTGGPTTLICRYSGTPRGASWGTDDIIVFGTNDPTTGLMTVKAGGGEPTVVTKPDNAHNEADHILPFRIRGSQSVLFTIIAPSGTDTGRVAVLDLGSGSIRTLLNGGSDPEYVNSGHLVYAAGGSVRAVRFDADRAMVLSDPVPVIDQVMTMQSGAADFRVAEQGTAVYVPGTLAAGGGPQRTLTWVTRDGRQEPIAAPARAYTIPRLSPDDAQAALDIRDQKSDIWIWNFSRQTLTPLTFDPAPDVYPVWTPDGKRILFGSLRTNGLSNLYWQSADGTGAAERLTTSPNIQDPSSISPDGTLVVFRENVSRTGSDLMLLHLDTRRVEPLLQSPFNEFAADISPDGHWLAYYSNESGQPEVYVRPFPNVNAGRWQISSGGGSRPAWSKDGRELFFLSSPDAAMMAIRVQTSGTTFMPGNATKIFDGPWYNVQSGRTYDVSRDGKRFLMIKDNFAIGNRSLTSTKLTVVLNWTEELKRLAPLR